MPIIEPYGGHLVDRTVPLAEAADLLAEVEGLPGIELSHAGVSDLFLIAVGGLSPLTGFMSREEYDGVLEDMALPDNLPWSIPIVLPAQSEEGRHLGSGGRAKLVAPDGRIAGIINVTDAFERDLDREGAAVYGTRNLEHSGVAAPFGAGPLCVSGPIRYLYPDDISGFPDEHVTPAETRERFRELGWKTIVAFQTRNPIHRAHEHLQKCALEIVNGLLLHLLVGETKSDDIPIDIRMDCYRTILEHFYPADRVVLSVLTAAIRYAGPREAIHHWSSPGSVDTPLLRQRRCPDVTREEGVPSGVQA